MSDRSLLELLDEVRGKTLMLLGGLSDEHARWAPPGLANSVLWHAGHSYVLSELLIVQSLGQPRQLPPGWYEMFSWDSRPALVPLGDWPPLAEVAAQLRAQHARLQAAIAPLTEEQLAGPAPRRPRQTLRYLILHALHDEACHSGEAWLLRKLQGA